MDRLKEDLMSLNCCGKVSYLSQNWPVVHVAASKDGMYLAVAGLHGYELLFYPRYHLDQSSLLCRKPLLAKPMVMDLSGELTPSSSPDLQLSTARELSIMTAKSHPAAMRFIPDQLSREHVSKNQISTPSDLLGKEPVRCLILRANGELSLLDLDDGRERELTDSVELFWVTCGQSEEKTNLIEEVWYPSLGVDPFKQEDFLQLDPELEFDREVYPLGLLPNAGVVVGVSQRMSFSACTEFPCFEPTPQAQTILHCLVRHLLQRDKSEEALLLAQLSAQKPHFFHCLEWLLFTVFEAEIPDSTNEMALLGRDGAGNYMKLN
ncbi:RAB6A-GEF complex partner protein 1 [Camellia lanceoleosa]|uniref:RAB6A-GEF complex partner protein 1 n=1 Tax=Camellia lanceoleosa TaxID=1840588 RepID=A0ACC0IM49_9ERIC|nr:RAB6A-GEF complex partner protein 1 [Camellia lanceoleosa]